MNFLISALSFIIIFGIIIFVHELGHFVAAKKTGVKVNEFALGMGPVVFSRQKGETTYSLRALPIGGFVSMEGEDEDSKNKRAFCNKKPWQKFVTIAAGPLMNIVLGFVIMLVIVMMGDGIATTQIHSFYDNAATAQYLQAGDKIVAIDGHKTRTSNDISYYLMREDDGIMDITVIRDGEELLIPNVQFDMTEANGQNIIVLDFVVVGVPKTVFNVPVYAVDWTKSIMRQIWSAFGDIFKGKVKLNDLSGPVGVAQVIGEASNSRNIESLLITSALITINIGIFNLLPFPALDGGRLVFIVLEAIRKKPVKAEIEGYINFAGLVILMGFMLIVTFKDVFNLFAK